MNSIAFLEQMGYTCIPPGKEHPTEWSEEDENAMTYFHELIGFGVTEKFCDAQTASDMRNWLNTRLKSLRPQPKHRDTYYDIIHNILDMLKDMDFMKITPEHRVSLLNDIRVKCKNADECATILDVPSWKPSEEQIWALQAIINDPNNAGAESCQLAIKSLLEHLKNGEAK